MKSFRVSLTDLECITIKFIESQIHLSLFCIIVYSIIIFLRLEACHKLRNLMFNATLPFHFRFFTPIYPPAKHAYTSNFIFEVKFNHLGKGSASLKAISGTSHTYPKFHIFCPKVTCTPVSFLHREWSCFERLK